MQECPDCERPGIFGAGNGKCRKCYGSGKAGTIADDIAGGKRPCPLCHGTGKCQTCGGSGRVSSTAPPPKRPHAEEELNPFDDKVAVRMACPKCGDTDWFEWKFLGKLTDPVCGHTWYVGSGFYTLMQIRAIVKTSTRFAKQGTKGGSGGQGAWIGKILGWFVSLVFGFCIRLEAALFAIPIQAIAGLCQPNKERAEVVSRSIVVGVFVVAAGIGIFALHQATKPLPAMPRPTSVMAVLPQQPLSSAGGTSGRRAAITGNALLGRWAAVNNPDAQSGTENVVESGLVPQQVFLSGNRVLEKSYGAGDPGEPYPWRILDSTHIQIDLTGSNRVPITVIYEVFFVNGKLRMNCVAKDYHGQGSGGCAQDKQVWSLVSRSQSLTKDEQTSANRLTNIGFVTPPR
jgi:hypothetical protein